jgi:hypothetical protein
MRIDPTHSRAISIEVAEKLRLVLPKEELKLPRSLEDLVSRLPELDEDSRAIVPDDRALDHQRRWAGGARSTRN